MPVIPYDDLEAALHWVSGAPPFEFEAYISKTTGQVFYASRIVDVEDELPDDYEDASLYWTVPHKQDLNLGKALVFAFADERLAPALADKVEEIFRRRGAYGRFKDLLEREGRLDEWYAYERQATQAALLAWAADKGMRVAVPEPGVAHRR